VKAICNIHVLRRFLMRLTLACPRRYATFMSWFKNAEAIRDFLDGRKVLRFKSNQHQIDAGHNR
jgi:hypothetical protein